MYQGNNIILQRLLCMQEWHCTLTYLQTLDNWGFSIFQAESLTLHQPLRYIGYELFKRHNLLSAHKVCILHGSHHASLSMYMHIMHNSLMFFQISPVVLDAFLCQLEKGYKTHNNFYHNETHGADVLQTVHALICSARLEQVRRFAAHTLNVCVNLVIIVSH